MGSNQRTCCRNVRGCDIRGCEMCSTSMAALMMQCWLDGNVQVDVIGLGAAGVEDILIVSQRMATASGKQTIHTVVQAFS